MARDRTLAYASVAFVVSVVLHGTDHILFQDRGLGALNAETIVAGGVAALAGLTTLAVVLAGHPGAPALATGVGFSAAAGVSAVHLLPEWSAFSDPYPDLSLGAYAWSVALLEIVTGVALGLAGARALWRSRTAVAPR